MKNDLLKKYIDRETEKPRRNYSNFKFHKWKFLDYLTKSFQNCDLCHEEWKSSFESMVMQDK